jgi:hypothetical protein
LKNLTYLQYQCGLKYSFHQSLRVEAILCVLQPTLRFFHQKNKFKNQLNNKKPKIMKKAIFLIPALLISGLLFFNSCQKGDELVTMAEVMEEDDEIDSYLDDLMEEIDDITNVDNTLKSGQIAMEGQSGTRVISTSFSGDTIFHTINYTDFVHPNAMSERVKNGTIIIKILGRPIQSVFWRQVTLVDFMVNEAFVEGLKVIEKTANNQFSMTLTGGKITFADGTEYSRAFNRTRTQTEGTSTPYFIWDDVFEIEGQANGINRNKKTYTRTITSPLIKPRNCRWFVKGTIDFATGENTATLDYGNGSCDRFATLTVNGESREIRLRMRGSAND